MGNISVSLPSDGTTADVSDYNTPITTIVNAINGGLDNTNIAAGAALDPTKISGGNSGMFDAWSTFTPTITATTTNPTLGNSVLVGYYKQTGKTVHAFVQLTVGSTFTAGSGTYRFALPVAANTAHIAINSYIGTSGFQADNSAAETGIITFGRLISSTTLEVGGGKAGGFGSTASAFPFAWASNDSICFSVTYEAA